MRRGPLLALLVLAMAASALSANMICIKIEAELASVSDPYNLLQGAIQPGLMMYGLYTYESTTEDNNSLPTVGDYWHYRDPYGIKVAVGPFIFETDPTNVQFLVEIVNDHLNPPRDNYLLRSYYNLPLPDGIRVDHISWQLDDPEATALESEKLPEPPKPSGLAIDLRPDDHRIRSGRGVEAVPPPGSRLQRLPGGVRTLPDLHLPRRAGRDCL